MDIKYKYEKYHLLCATFFTLDAWRLTYFSSPHSTHIFWRDEYFSNTFELYFNDGIASYEYLHLNYFILVMALNQSDTFGCIMFVFNSRLIYWSQVWCEWFVNPLLTSIVKNNHFNQFAECMDCQHPKRTRSLLCSWFEISVRIDFEFR